MNEAVKWKNTNKDQLPLDNQDVLISVDGIYYTAVYTATEKGFKLKYELGKFFLVENTAIYWKVLTPPS
jgi:hypothetical protein